MAEVISKKMYCVKRNEFIETVISEMNAKSKLRYVHAHRHRQPPSLPHTRTRSRTCAHTTHTDIQTYVESAHTHTRTLTHKHACLLAYMYNLCVYVCDCIYGWADKAVGNRKVGWAKLHEKITWITLKHDSHFVSFTAPFCQSNNI